MRLLSIPGRHHENRYFGLILASMEEAGITVVDPRLGTLLGFRFDVLHLNFPTHYITERSAGPAAAFAVAMGLHLLLVRLLGRSIVYTVHDVTPIKLRNRRILWPFLGLVHRLTNGYVFLSRSSQRQFIATYPSQAGKPWVLARHGPYPVTRLSDAERVAHRRLLTADEGAFLVGLLGSIKPYKDPGALRTLPDRLQDGRTLRIVVAGRIEAGYEAEIGAELDRLPASIVRLDRSLSDAELDALIQTVDVVVLPYLRGSNSGVALLVLANGGRLIGSTLPMFRELAEDLGPPWVEIADGPAGGLRAAVERAARRPVTAQDREALAAYLKDIGFAAGGRAIAAFCRDIVRCNASGRAEAGQPAGR